MTSGTMTKEGLVVLANEMLNKLHVTARVQHWSDITADVFVTLLEGLLAESPPDIVRPARTREDEIHNCQAVIDTLSMDVLNTPLSHITGEAVVEGDIVAIGNLLDILSSLMEYLLDKIGSDISTDNDDELREDIEDPDRVTPTVIDDILERELGQGYRGPQPNGVSWQQAERDRRTSGGNEGRLARSHNSRSYGDNTSDLIALGQSGGSTSMHREVGETTADLIALGDSVYKMSPSKRPATTAPSSVHQERFSWTEDPLRAVPSGSRNSTTELIREGDSLEKRFALSAATVASQPATTGTRGTSTLGASSMQHASTADRLRYTAPEPRALSTADFLNRHGSSGRHGAYGATVPATSSQLQHGRHDMRGTALAAPVSSRGSDVPILDSSLGSSVAMPQVPVSSQQDGNEFASLGMPRSHPLPGDGAAQGWGLPDPLTGAPPSSITCHMYHHFEAGKAGGQPTSLASTAPTASSRTTTSKAAPTTMSSTAPAAVAATSVQRDPKLQPYQNLQSLMHDTMAMAKAALQTSPFKEKDAAPTHGRADQGHRDRGVEELSQHMSLFSLGQPQGHSTQTHSTVGTATTPSLNRTNMSESVSRSREHLDLSLPSAAANKQGILSPPRKTDADTSRRKVSFLMSRSSEDSSQTGTATDTSRDDAAPGYSMPLSTDENIRNTLRKYYELQASAGRRPATAPPRSSRAATTSPKQKKTAAPSVKRTGKAQPQTNVRSYGQRKEVSARNAEEYLSKYYGHGRLQSTSDGEVDYGSDRGEYSADISDIDSDILGEHYHELPDRIRKSVRFDHLLDDSVPGKMDGIRRKLNKEDEKARVKAQFVGQQYRDDLMDVEEEVREALQKELKKSKDTEKKYQKKVQKGRKTKDRTPKKYSVPSSVLYPKGRSRTRSRSIPYRGRKRSASASPAYGRIRDRVAGPDLLPMLLEEFPYMYLSTETLHSLWHQSSHQVEQLSRAEMDVNHKKKTAQCQIEEADRRQKVISTIMKKELDHRQRVRDIKERKRQQYSVNSQLREKRQQSARARRYYDEYQVRMRSKMLKKRTKEELVFKKLFHEGIDIQKDRIRELRKYAREQREVRAKKQKDELESQENYYRDQFNMLADVMAKERQEIELRETAQSKVLQKMQTELRRKMEGEIRGLQEQIFRDEDDVYFRELDAERLRQQLQLARYQVRV